MKTDKQKAQEAWVAAWPVGSRGWTYDSSDNTVYEVVVTESESESGQRGLVWVTQLEAIEPFGGSWDIAKDGALYKTRVEATQAWLEQCIEHDEEKYLVTVVN